MLEILGQTVTTPVVKDSGETHTLPTAPQYVVYPVEWSKVDTAYCTNEPCVNDLGEAFPVDSPPEDLGIPPPYRSPELFLEKDSSKVVGFASDLWALGCTLFEIRTGRRLFHLFDNEDDDYLDAMVTILGRMPEPWWSTTWEARKRWWKDEADSQGRAVRVSQESTRVQDPIPKTWESTVHPSVAEGARSLGEVLIPGVWYIDMDEKDERAHRDIPEKERELFADLLGLLLRWQPQERLSAEEVLKHEWFTL